MTKHSRPMRRVLDEVAAELDENLDDLRQQIAELGARLATVEGILREPARDPAMATTKVEHDLIGIKASIATLSSSMTVQRTDLSRSDEATHQSAAREYEVFVEHLLGEVVRDALGTDDDTIIGRGIAPLSRVLFQPKWQPAPLEDATQWLAAEGLPLRPHEIADLRKRAARLKEMGRVIGSPVRWDFVASHGVRVDPATQRVWTGSDESAPVVAVVAPAYKVRDETFCPQFVLTMRPAPELTPAAPDQKADAQ